MKSKFSGNFSCFFRFFIIRRIEEVDYRTFLSNVYLFIFVFDIFTYPSPILNVGFPSNYKKFQTKHVKQIIRFPKPFYYLIVLLVN